MTPALKKRIAARTRTKEEAKELRPALESIRQAFFPEMGLAQMVRYHMVAPIFGSRVNITNYRDADVEATCRKGHSFGSHLDVCPCGEEAAAYKKAR